jgi:hypothetical protein
VDHEDEEDGNRLIVALVVADLNGDGWPGDLAVTDIDEGYSILLNKGDGTFGAPTHIQTGAVHQSITAGDLNGDGRTDLIGSGPNLNTMSAFMNQCR